MIAYVSLNYFAPIDLLTIRSKQINVLYAEKIKSKTQRTQTNALLEQSVLIKLDTLILQQTLVLTAV